jgi:hypothetical protein
MPPPRNRDPLRGPVSKEAGVPPAYSSFFNAATTLLTESAASP